MSSMVQVYKQQDYTSDESNEDKEWNQLGKDILVSTAGDWTGKNLLSFNDDGILLAIVGQVQVLTLDSQTSAWKLVGNLIPAGEQPGEHFGASVSLSADGSTIAVGSPFYSDNSTNDAVEKIGRVTLWKSDSSSQTWTQSKTIIGEAADDKSGTTVALSSQGCLLAVGAPSNDGESGKLNAGHVRLYKYISDNNDWTQCGRDIDGDFVWILVQLQSLFLKIGLQLVHLLIAAIMHPILNWIEGVT